VVNVSWNDAMAYAESRKTGKPYRLLSDRSACTASRS
jgi:formylglycine-generating enzyme required for sulfatase activity